MATPGRLADHIDKQSIDLSNVEAIIMDETDEMLNIGFKVQIQEIIENVRASSGSSKDIQFLLFSATIPDWVSKDAVSFMGNNFKFIDMVSSSSQETPMNTQHMKLLVQNSDEAKGLISTLINKYAKNRGRCIVFTETKYEAKDLAKNNQIIGDVRQLHGDVDQSDRIKTFNDFKSGTANIIVATNVAARGLDFPNVDLVIQIHPPEDIESYIHRSGRTGRAGNSGLCVIIYTADEEYKLGRIEQVAKIKFDKHPPIAIEDKAELQIQMLMDHM